MRTALTEGRVGRLLATAMERVRACDEVKGEDGLCDCARFIGYLIREAHESRLSKVVGEMAAEIERLRSRP